MVWVELEFIINFRDLLVVSEPFKKGLIKRERERNMQRLKKICDQRKRL